MCKNLVEKGTLSSPLIIFNRTQKRADDLSASLESGKTKVAATIEDAVKDADIIFTCVGDDRAIKDTVDTALKTDVKGKLFVDCSTVHPETTDGLAKTIEENGAKFVACPVFGAPAMADSGQLVCVLAGPAAAVAEVKPYTTGVMGRTFIDFSDQPQGTATHLKIIGNTFILNMVETLAEGLTVAEKSGLGVDNLHKFIEALFPGPYAAYSTRMRSGDYHKRKEPLFAVDLARKDAKHAMDLAKSSGSKMPNVEVADRHLEQVKEHMGERGDISSIYGAVRKENGLEFEN
jgi:3-hydroxyisobutyrate dehydrogenase-like beta-hydroxyacid dehydrogenase